MNIEDENDTDETIICGQRPPFIGIGMVLVDDLTGTLMLVSGIRDDDASGLTMAVLRYTTGTRGERSCTVLRHQTKLARDYDGARAYTGEWRRGSNWCAQTGDGQ